MDIWRIILVSHKSHTIIRMTYFSREAYLNIKYLPCIKALLRELSFPVSLNIISVCNILISTLTYLQKDGCNQAITRLLNYEHVKVRQLSAHYITRSGAYISSKARLTQSLEYLRKSNKLLSKIIHHLDTLMIKALIHLKIITEVIQSHLTSEIGVTITQRTLTIL